MNARRSSKLTLGRYVFLLPVLIFVSLAFTVAKKEIIHEMTGTEDTTILPGSSAIITVPEISGDKDAATAPAKPRVRTNANQRNIVSSNVAPQQVNTQQYRGVRLDSISQITASSFPAPATLRVQGLPLSDTTPGLRRVRVDAIPADSVITVVGYPLKRNNPVSSREVVTKDSSGNQPSNTNTEKVVMGYRTPRNNN